MLPARAVAAVSAAPSDRRAHRGRNQVHRQHGTRGVPGIQTCRRRSSAEARRRNWLRPKNLGLKIRLRFEVPSPAPSLPKVRPGRYGAVPTSRDPNDLGVPRRRFHLLAPFVRLKRREGAQGRGRPGTLNTFH